MTKTQVDISPAATSVEPASVESAAPSEGQTLGRVFREMFTELIDHRELLFQFTVRNIRVRYKQALMGFAWALLMPMIIVAAGFLVKYAMTEMAGGQFEVGSFTGMAIKAMPWAFFVGAIGMATQSLVANRNLVTKIYFPREVLPVSAVLAQLFDTSIGALLLAIILFVFLGVGISLQILWVIPLVLCTLLFTTAVALLFSSGNLFFRDVRYLVQVILTFGIFFTPVFYEAVNLGPLGAQLVMINPLAPVLEGFRLAVVEHHNLAHALTVVSPAGKEVLVWHPGYLVYVAAWSLLGCGVTWLLFHKLEFIYAEYI
jgi:lipopolysaccharide transport system permease protein